jgi:hypothetical protein
MPSSSIGSDEASSEPSSWEKSQSTSPVIPNTKDVHRNGKVDKEIDKLWDDGQEWILIFDNLLKHPRGKTKGCKCDMCLMEKGSSGLSLAG